jgi:hypothetical protein
MDIGQAPGSLLLFIQPRTGNIVLEEAQPFFDVVSLGPPSFPSAIIGRLHMFIPSTRREERLKRGKEGTMVAEGGRGGGHQLKDVGYFQY